MDSNVFTTTPDPPYFAVILTSKTTAQEAETGDTAEVHVPRLAKGQPGYLGVETSTNENGQEITVSFWRDLASIEAWEKVVSRSEAQAPGQTGWFGRYDIRVCHIQDPSDFQTK